MWDWIGLIYIAGKCMKGFYRTWVLGWYPRILFFSLVIEEQEVLCCWIVLTWLIYKLVSTSSVMVRWIVSITFSCRMGKRKLRFNARKKDERNKYMKHELLVSILLSLVTLIINPCELVVSLPVSTYTSSILPNASTLHSRLILSQQLPLGWTASSVGSSSASHSACLAL